MPENLDQLVSMAFQTIIDVSLRYKIGSVSSDIIIIIAHSLIGFWFLSSRITSITIGKMALIFP